ncbi:MAG: hypothetical protein JO134_09160, partial [Xanthobacteraceae bacterium]|nr:hypothetical protein [Xanthobacteraceae bacterium]
ADVSLARQALGQIDRSHVIEEDERPDHAVARKGQNAADLEGADIAWPLINQQFDHPISPRYPDFVSNE